MLFAQDDFLELRPRTSSSELKKLPLEILCLKILHFLSPLLLKIIVKVDLVCSYYEQTGQATKRMNFRENSKRPLTPSSFSENYVAHLVQTVSCMTPMQCSSGRGITFNILNCQLLWQCKNLQNGRMVVNFSVRLLPCTCFTLCA